MNLPEISINRHVFAYMLSAVLVLFGIISYKDIGVDRYPTVEFPMISVTTILPGGTPEIIDSSITNLIESSVNSTPGIDHIRSSSSPGISVINIKFNMDKDVNVAFNEVQSRVNKVLRNLPNEAEPPVVAKIEFGALPVMWLVLTGDRTMQQLNLYARNVIKKRLETIDGVGEIQLGGEQFFGNCLGVGYRYLELLPENPHEPGIGDRHLAGPFESHLVQPGTDWRSA